MSATKEIPAHGTTKVYNEDGMCTIPQDIRKYLKLEKGDSVLFIEREGHIEVEKSEE